MMLHSGVELFSEGRQHDGVVTKRSCRTSLLEYGPVSNDALPRVGRGWIDLFARPAKQRHQSFNVSALGVLVSVELGLARLVSGVDRGDPAFDFGPRLLAARIIAVREPIELPFGGRGHVSRYLAMRLFMLAHPGYEAVPAMTEISGHGT